MTIFLQTIIVTPKALESIVLAKKLRQGKNMKSFIFRKIICNVHTKALALKYYIIDLVNINSIRFEIT